MSLNAAELHALARDKQARAPQPLRSVVARVQKAERERDDAAMERDEIIREMRNVGVPWVAIARWADLSERRVRTIVEDR